jgi:flagellar biosynthesis protein FlhB
MIGFMILAGIMMSMIMKTLTGSELQTPMPIPVGAMAIMYVAMAAIYFFPVYYLYRFSENLGQALETRSEHSLTTALQYLKNHYYFVGVLMIIGIVIMAMALLIAIVASIIGLGAAAGGGEFL